MSNRIRDNYDVLWGPPSSDELRRQQVERLKGMKYACLYDWVYRELGVTPQELRDAGVEKCYAIWVLSAGSTEETTERLINPIARGGGRVTLLDGNDHAVTENDTTFFFDVGSRNYRAQYLGYLLEAMDGWGYDGVVFDYWWPTMISRWITGWGRPAPPQYPDDAAWLEQAWWPFVEFVCDHVRKAGYKIVGNCAGEYGDTADYALRQRALIDADIYESFARNFDGTPLTRQRLAQRIQAFHDDPLMAWTADIGIRADMPDYEQARMLALAMYYISLPGVPGIHDELDKTIPERAFGYRGDGRIDDWLAVDVDLGKPIEAIATQVISPAGVHRWRREYEGGTALLNYEETPMEVSMDYAAYIDALGRPVPTRVIVPPMSGLILRPRRGQ